MDGQGKRFECQEDDFNFRYEMYRRSDKTKQ